MLHITTTDNNCAKSLSDVIDNTQENEQFTLSHYAELFRIANFTLSELCEKNKKLLVFPNNVGKTYGSIGDEKIFEMSGNLDFDKENLSRNIKIKTGNLMGFIGTGSTQIQITSRFADVVSTSVGGETSSTVTTTAKDFFLHCMLSKVFCPNLLSLNFDAFSAIKNQFDYLCFLFPLYLKNAMAQGIFKTYQKFERNDANVRGAINVSRHIAKNIPFAGKVAYTERTRAYDNPLTELVRHTIEVIKTKTFGKSILSEKNTSSLVSQIVEVTPAYNFFEREKIIFKNAKPLSHPFFTEWKPLQKLCLAILRNQKINFHADSNEIYGILFDGAWLWEEYLATVLKPLGFLHPKNKESRGGIKVFENSSLRFFPDFYNENLVLDAKYKNYGKTCVQSADYHQIISYMHLLKLKSGGFVFPDKAGGFDAAQPPQKSLKLAGLGGEISVFGFKIPQSAVNFEDFCEEIKKSEAVMLNLIQHL